MAAVAEAAGNGPRPSARPRRRPRHRRPEGRLRLLTGRGRLAGPRARSTTTLARAAAPSRTPRSGGTVISDAVRAVLADGAVAADRVVAVALHRPVGEHRARSTPTARPVGDCIMWKDTPGRRLRPASHRRTGRRLRTRGRSPPGSAHRRAASPAGTDPIGHMLHLAHDQPEVARRRPLVPRAGRLPLDALHRRAAAIARVDDRGVAHRQPRPRPCWPTTTSWSRLAGVDRAEAAAARRRPARWSATVRADVAAELGLPARRAGRHRARPTCTPPRVGAGARRATTRPTSRSAPRRGSAARCRSRRPTSSTGSPASPGSRPAATCSPTTTTPRAVPRVAPRQRRRPTTACAPTARPQLRRPHRAGRDVAARRAAACSSRRGSTGERIAGRRPPRARRLPQPVARDHPRRPGAGGARGRRLQQPVAARVRREVRQAAARPDPRHRRRRRVRPVVPDPRRRHGPHDRAGRRAAATPSSAAPRSSPAWRSARCGRDEVRDLVRRRATFTPDPANRQVYDRLSAEFPKLYTAQKGMFRRLNRRWS